MSSRARLILLSGVGGAGTSTICAATSAALADEGLHVVVIDASRPGLVDDDVVATVETSIGRVLAELGADPVLSESWTSLAPVGQLSALALVVGALSEADVDAIVVDCGDLARARELVELPAILNRLLDAALTPRLAMWRSSTVPGEAAAGEGTVFEALSSARAEVVRMQQVLVHPDTTMRLVTVPEQRAVGRTARALAEFALLGVAVDGVVVNRYPRKSESAAARDEADRALDAMTQLADSVPVWRSTSSLRPVPKGRSAMGPLGRVRVLDAEQLIVHVTDDAYALDIALAGPARSEARVGMDGDQLVVDLDGCRRWLDLPPVLRRCRPLYADRTEDGLRVTFEPDPRTWRAPAVAS